MAQADTCDSKPERCVSGIVCIVLYVVAVVADMMELASSEDWGRDGSAVSSCK
jgi:hypothetical protein